MLADESRYDLIVIGAGINGAAIAREAALGGFDVLVLEQGDLACGTTGASTRLIHGGLRYLEHAEFSLVRESLAERERLLGLAGHLVEPLGIYIPVFERSRRSLWQIRLGMRLYDLLFPSRLLPGHTRLSREALLERLPGLTAQGVRGGVFYFDAQIAFPERLVLEQVLDAVKHGAALSTYTRVSEILVDGGVARGVSWREGSGTRGRAWAPVVVNAAGPWVDRVLGELGRRPLIGGTKGSHLVVEPFDGAPPAAVYAEAASDGRPFFIIPWNGLYLIGTTDQRYEGDPGSASISDSEFDYLLSEAGRLFPAARRLSESVLYTQAGIRPLPYRPRHREGAITRRHLIREHPHARGLFSIIGGKLTTHRVVAEQVMKRLSKALGARREAGATRTRALPGALPAEARDELLERIAARFGASQAQRLWRTYGGRALEVIERIDAQPELGAEICPHSHAFAAECVHAVESEWALTLTDILQRRCMAGLGRDFGLAAAPAGADWLARLGIWDAARAEQELAAYRGYARRFRVRALREQQRQAGAMSESDE